MRQCSGPRAWLLNLSIKSKLYLIIGLLIADVALVISLGIFALNTSSSIRASLAGEDLWAKAQKTAIYSLEKYAQTQDESAYQDYLAALPIPNAYERANFELRQANPDPDKFSQALRDAGMHAEDIPGVVRLFLHFRFAPHIDAAFRAWTEAQTLVTHDMQDMGRQLRTKHLAGELRKEDLPRYVSQIEKLNRRITALEIQFSTELGAASRWATHAFVAVMGLGSLCIGLLSISLALYIGRFIVAGVEKIAHAASRAAQGDLTVRVEIPTRDELGRLADAFNHMTEGLGRLDVLKTEFFSNVSHEFRTPLTLIVGPLERLLSSTDPSLPRNSLEVVYRNALRLLSLVNALLDFSRLEAGRLTARFVATDLSTCTCQLASHFATTIEMAGLEFEVNCDEAPRRLYVDCDLWEKLVSNLLSNALKFTFAGKISIGLHYDTNGARLTVKDTGTGIPASELPRLFERFYRIQGAQSRTHEGAGIGLSLVSELTRLHGGSVAVDSAVGRGTTFTVHLPFGSAHLPREQTSDQPRSPSSGRIATATAAECAVWLPTDAVVPPADASTSTVLVVDDNADMRAHITELLSSKWSVEQASDGCEALDKINKGLPDLIVSDILMPNMDGFALLRTLRQNPETRHLPIILLSARAGEEARTEGISEGADDYLVKPFSAKELIARVDTHLKMVKVREEVAFNAASIARLEHERKWLEEILGLMPIPLILADSATGRIVFANHAADVMAGGKLQKDVPIHEYGKAYRLTDALDRDLPVDAYPLVRAVRGDTISAESVVWHSAAGRFTVLVNAQTVRGSYGHPTTILCAFQDVSALAKEIEARDDFLSIASHELKTPVTSLKLQLQLAERELRSEQPIVQPAERLVKLVQTFGSQVDRLTNLVEDLLDVSRMRLGKLNLNRELCSLSDLVKQTIEQLSTDLNSAACPVEVDIEEDVVGVWDRKRIQQVVTNLMTNATKYAPGKPIRISLSKNEAGARFFIQDFGPGIEKHRQARLFERYERADVSQSVSGLGLGLFISREIIEAHGGSIRVFSEPGKGCVFTVDLPCSPDPPPADSARVGLI